MTFVPTPFAAHRGLRRPGRTALLSALLTAHAWSCWAAVTSGTQFGTAVDAGGLKQGGAYQSAASATYSPDGNKSASASGGSSFFNLHAYAWTSENPTLPSYCTVYTCTWQTYAEVTVWDTITVTAPAGSSPHQVGFDFTIDGTKKRGKWAYGDGAYASASYYFGTDPNGWYRPRTVSLGSGETELNGEITVLPGSSLTIYLMGTLSVSARSGSVADYSHTMKFHWDLPAGWTYTSASGQFSPAPSPVPEPASAALMLAGLACVAGVKRRRLRG
jgi:hypothetical protein